MISAGIGAVQRFGPLVSGIGNIMFALRIIVPRRRKSYNARMNKMHKHTARRFHRCQPG